MIGDALDELDSLPQNLRERPEVLGAKLTILMKSRDWEQAVATGLHLCEIAPQSNHAYLHTAYCLHEQGKTDEARKLLLNGPKQLREEAVYHYNLACYSAVLKDTDVAMAYLAKSIEMNAEFLQVAKSDPDLQAIRETL